MWLAIRYEESSAGWRWPVVQTRFEKNTGDRRPSRSNARIRGWRFQNGRTDNWRNPVRRTLREPLAAPFGRRMSVQRVDGVGARTWRRTVARRHTDGHRRYGQQNDQCRANPPPQLREICQLKHLRHYSTTEYRTQLKQTSRGAHIGNCTPKELDQLGFPLVARSVQEFLPVGHKFASSRLPSHGASRFKKQRAGITFFRIPFRSILGIIPGTWRGKGCTPG